MIRKLKTIRWIMLWHGIRNSLYVLSNKHKITIIVKKFIGT